MDEIETIKILLTGDFCPQRRIEGLALEGDYKSIFNDFLDIFQGNDLNIIDLECPLTLTESARPKTGPHQKAHPDTIGLLKHVGVDLVALANNHIMDYDFNGVTDTLELCKNNGIHTVGLGKSREEAASPYSFITKGRKIGILNFADNEFLSTRNNSYTCNAVDPIRCAKDIENARLHHDYIIVIVHAGNEFYHLPSPRTRELYRFIIDRGADALISHHTHVFSGYEIYNERPIFYGLGNFIYDWPEKVNTDWNKGFVVKLLIGDTMNFEIIPLKQSNELPGVFKLSPAEEALFTRDIEKLNILIQDDVKLELAFQEYCESVYPMYNAFIEPYFGRIITALQKRRLLPKLLSRKKRLYHLNLTRCESHRDVLIRMLKNYE